MKSINLILFTSAKSIFDCLLLVLLTGVYELRYFISGGVSGPQATPFGPKIRRSTIHILSECLELLPIFGKNRGVTIVVLCFLELLISVEVREVAVLP